MMSSSVRLLPFYILLRLECRDPPLFYALTCPVHFAFLSTANKP